MLLQLAYLSLDDARGLDGLRCVRSIGLGGDLPPIAPNLASADDVELSVRDGGALHFWPSLEHLKHLTIRRYSLMADVSALRNLRRVDVLVRANNDSLMDLSGLHGLEHVNNLHLWENPALTTGEIDGLVDEIDWVGDVEVR